jgi:hypothetical protein
MLNECPERVCGRDTWDERHRHGEFMIDAGEISSYGFELEEVSREQSWEVRGRAQGWL